MSAAYRAGSTVPDLLLRSAIRPALRSALRSPLEKGVGGWWSSAYGTDVGLAIDFANNRTYNAGVQSTPFSLLTYTAPSNKTVTGSDGLLRVTNAAAELPIDYDPITLACKGVLIEEQRTNLLTYSEQFDNAAWTKTFQNSASAPVVTANQAVAPDGTMTADLVEFATVGTTSGDRSRLYHTYSAAGVTGTYTYSVWVKSTGADQTFILLLANAVSVNITVTNVWQRFQISYTFSAATLNLPELRLSGNLATSGSIYLWGAQLEAGAFPTSYIPTVASQVTRAADQLSLLTSAFGYSQTEGTWFANFSLVGYVANYRVVAGGSAYRWMYGPTNVTTFNAFNGAASISKTITSPVSRTVKGASAYSAAGRSLSADGLAAAEDANPYGTAVTTVGIGNGSTGSDQLNGHIKSLAYWPTRKSNAYLQQVTT